MASPSIWARFRTAAPWERIRTKPIGGTGAPRGFFAGFRKTQPDLASTRTPRLTNPGTGNFEGQLPRNRRARPKPSKKLLSVRANWPTPSHGPEPTSRLNFEKKFWKSTSPERAGAEDR